MCLVCHHAATASSMRLSFAITGFKITTQINSASASLVVEIATWLYEESKLLTTRAVFLPSLRRLLSKWSIVAGLPHFAAFYSRDGAATAPITQSTTTAISQQDAPFNVVAWLADAVAKRPVAAPPTDAVPASCRVLRALLPAFAALAADNYVATVDALVQHGFDGRLLAELTPGMTLCLLPALRWCRAAPPMNWPAAAYALVGRPDLAAMAEPPATAPHLAPGALRFWSDRRMSEAERLLRSDTPMLLRVRGAATAAGAADHATASAQQNRLAMLCARAMAKSVGRGMLQLGSAVARLTDALTVPPLSLAGRLPPNDAVITLDAAALPAGATAWPELHNGTASGLRFSAEGAHIARTWIVSARPGESRDAHAGLLLGLGLRGLLPALHVTDLVHYLSMRHETTAVAILLGMSAARRGTMDATVHRMLTLHVPSLLPPAAQEVDTPPLVQTAALVGVGLLYMGSAHRRTAECLLLAEALCRAMDDRPDREGYAVSAAVGLGLLACGMGHAAPGLVSLHLDRVLMRLLEGGPVPAEWAGFMRDLQCDTLSVRDVINTDVVAPAAALALALLFLRSHDAGLAARVAVPDTAYLLSRVRPDVMLLRTVARCLIMWDEMRPTQQWLDSILPRCVRTPPSDRPLLVRPAAAADSDTELLAIARVSIMTGACLSLGLRYAGQGDADAAALIRSQLLPLARAPPRTLPADLVQTSISVLAAALAMVMAGTGDIATMKTLRALHRRVSADVTYGNHMCIAMSLGLLFLGRGEYSLSNSADAVALLLVAFFPRFPTVPGDNRFHLQALRHLYVLAAETRNMRACDVETAAPVAVPAEVTTRDEATDSEHTDTITLPTLLPPAARIVRLRIVTPRYWPVDLRPAEYAYLRAPIAAGVCTSAAGYLPYELDPATTLRLARAAAARYRRRRVCTRVLCRPAAAVVLSRLCGPTATTALVAPVAGGSETPQTR